MTVGSLALCAVLVLVLVLVLMLVLVLVLRDCESHREAPLRHSAPARCK